MGSQSSSSSNTLDRVLNVIERAGNALPHPTMLFLWLSLIVIAFSAVTAFLDFQAFNPITEQTVEAKSLLSVAGLHYMLTNTVSNFVLFAPVGTVLVAILGIGVAEHSGLLKHSLVTLVRNVPPSLLTYTVVLAGVLSNLAVDAGYVVLIPLAGILFASAGLHPLAGMAAAFAGVSAGFSANLLVSPLDAILAGLSTESMKAFGITYEVNALGNYYFILVSTFLITLVGGFVTNRFVIKRLPSYTIPPDEDLNIKEFVDDSTKTKRASRAVILFTVAFIGLLSWGSVPESGFLRHPETGLFLTSPFIGGIVTVIAFYAVVAGLIFGLISGRYKRSSEMVEGMEDSMRSMGTYLVLMFFAAQFVNYFGWTNLGEIISVLGANLLQTMELSGWFLLVAFVFIAGIVNIFVGSASAKWALMAPIFVPLFYQLGISPEATQMAYRIGDSTTNIITPLMPYFGVFIAFAQKYNKELGIGTVIATMLPYSIALFISWVVLLVVWLFLDLPLGPGVVTLIS